MRLHLIGIRAMALFAALAAVPASAFVLQAKDSGGALIPRRWSPGWSPIHFLLNDRPFDLLPNLAPGSTPLPAIQAAMDAWAIDPIRFALAGTITNASRAADGVNLITFADTPQNRAAVGTAPTSVSLYSYTTDPLSRIVEADIVLSPALPFATDGRPEAYDVEDRVIRALGQTLGLASSPMAASAMFPFAHPGQALRHRLSTDDIAGLRTLYGLGAAPGEGAIHGRVTTEAGDPVFGAYVSAVDAGGLVRVGVLADQDGQFVIPSLPAGTYQVYAEPLDGPFTPAELPAAYSSIRNDFRLQFAGGNLMPAAIMVTGGATTDISPIHVVAQKASLKIKAIAWSPDGQSFSPAYPQALPIQPGQSRYLEIVGEGVQQLDPAGINISGTDPQPDPAHLFRGAATDGTPYLIVPVTARMDAPPGPRNLYLSQSDERAVFTGCLEVVSP
jgi:hypothetical protein